MNSRDFSRLSVGITYRFDVKKMLLSQMGALIALVAAIATEGNPPFGDNPFEIFSPVTFFLLINVLVFGYTIYALGSSSVKIFPSMLIYNSRGEQTRIDFSRVMRASAGSSKDLHFYISDSSGKETLGLKIKNYGVYTKSDEMMTFLKYILKDKFSSASPLKGELTPKQKFRIPNRFFGNQ
jgi:hypothetical protein